MVNMSIEFEELAPGIIVYKNVIQNHSVIMPDIESVVSIGFANWQPSGVYIDGTSNVRPDHRDTDQIFINYTGKDQEDYSDQVKLFNSSLSSIFFRSFDNIEKHYSSMFGAMTSGHEGYTILKYGVGQKFNNHIDDHPTFKNPRRVSLVYYANDEFEGGKITFDKFNIEYQPKANEAILFPSNFMYSHTVHPVISGTRYAVVTWLN